MDDLRKLLSDPKLSALRAGYSRDVMRGAMLSTTVSPYPPLGAWNEAIASTFYADGSPLEPKDRERCIIVLLAHTGAQFSLCVHVYWGLMEGLTVSEICHTIGVAACYGGIASLGHCYPVLNSVLTLLAQIAESSACSTPDVLTRMVAELATTRPH